MKRALLPILFLILAWPANAMDIQEITTPRGISLWFIKDSTTPALTVSFAFRGGTESDPKNKQGRAFLMAAALTEGTADMPADVFQQVLADRNIALGFSATREAISGYLRYLLRHETAALELAADALYRPAFDPADVERLKSAMQSGIKSQEADPAFRAARLTMLQTFGDHAYGHAARGTPATIKNLSAADLRQLHSTHFTRANLLVVVTGDTTSTHAAEVIDTLFAALPKGKETQAAQTTRQNVGSVWFNPWPSSEQNAISFTAPAVPIHSPDYPAALILNDLVAAGGFRALLMDRLRQELGATYGISASIENLDALSFTMGGTNVQADATDKALAIIKDIWSSIQSIPFDEEEIAISKNYLASSFSRDLTSSRAIAAYALGLRLARLPADYATQLPRALHAVSQEDLARAATQLYNPSQLSFVISGPVAPAAKDRTVRNIWTLE